MEHDDFSGDISSDDIIDDEHEEQDDFNHEHEKTNKYMKAPVLAYKIW